MPTVDQRLASLEARVDAMSDVRNLIAELRADMNARFTEVNRQCAELREDMNRRFSEVNERFTQIDQRFTQIDQRFVQIDQRFTLIDQRFTDANRRVGSLDAKIDRHFIWLMGMMVTGFITVIGALVGIVYR